MRAASSILVAGAVLCASAAPAQATGPHQPVPNTRAATYDRGVVHVSGLHMRVERAGAHLHATVTLRVTGETNRRVVRSLQVGACTGGSLDEPVCPPAGTFAVSVPAHATTTFSRTVVLHQPPAAFDAVQATVRPPGAKRPTREIGSDAFLTLRGSAWRGAAAGQPFGISLPSDGTLALRRMLVYGQQGSGDTILTFVQWEAPVGTDVSAFTTVSRSCAGPTCATRTITPQKDFTKAPNAFGAALGLTRPPSAQSYEVTVTDAAAHTVGHVLLPWPVA